MITREKTGKVKRIKNNPHVKISMFTFGGKINREWTTGIMCTVFGEESQMTINLRKKKHGFKAIIAQFASRGKGNLIVFSIKLE